MTSNNGFRGFATVNIFAVEHDKAKAWYTEVFGIEPYFNRPGYCEFRIGDVEAEFGIIDKKFAPYLDPKAGPAGAIVHWAVDDLEATFARLQKLGGTVLVPITKHGEGFVVASVVDPFGNILGIMQNTHYVEMVEKRLRG